MTAPCESGGGGAGVLSSLSTGHDLSSSLAEAAMSEILAGTASSAQIAAFIVALRMKGETVDELTGLLAAMHSAAEPVPLAPDGLVDTCGTGGDRSHTINVSTLAAFVVAGAGAKVCKHGNRAASSACGSADLLEALGVVIDLAPAGVARCVTEAGMGFCFAPLFHPAMRHAAATRRELGVATVCNFLGPMANPARLRRQVIGVSDPSMAARMAEVLRARGAERALVVYGHDGLDELTTTTTSTVLDVVNGDIRRYEVDPASLRLAPARPDELRGGDAATNASLARRVLDGERGAHRDVVALNAAAGVVAAGLAEDLAAGLELASASPDDGGAAGVVDRMVSVSKTFAA
ncbi:anthranilate phosphoribosyltransferase [soil metagenome]